jgi:hypothetical protein
MRCLAVLILVAALPARADELMTDAFGIALAADSARAGWAGYRETMTGVGETIVPGPGAQVQFYLGAKSLVAGLGQGLAMALVTDLVGNMVADGAGVEFAIDAARHQAVTQNGIAAVTVGPFTQAGQFHAGAAIKGQQSTRHEYVVTADLRGIAPALLPQGKPALAEDFQDVATAVLTDRFGNPVTEGSGLTFLLTGADGSTSVLPAVTLNGAALGKLLVRDIAAQGVLQASFGASTSLAAPLRTVALNPVGDLAITVTALPDIAATRLQIGPFLTDAGHVLNDGATVTLQITTKAGAMPSQTGWVLDGAVDFTTLISPDDFPIALTITSPLGSISRRIAAPKVAP